MTRQRVGPNVCVACQNKSRVSSDHQHLNVLDAVEAPELQVMLFTRCRVLQNCTSTCIGVSNRLDSSMRSHCTWRGSVSVRGRNYGHSDSQAPQTQQHARQGRTLVGAGDLLENDLGTLVSLMPVRMPFLRRAKHGARCRAHAAARASSLLATIQPISHLCEASVCVGDFAFGRLHACANDMNAVSNDAAIAQRRHWAKHTVQFAQPTHQDVDTQSLVKRPVDVAQLHRRPLVHATAQQRVAAGHNMPQAGLKSVAAGGMHPRGAGNRRRAIQDANGSALAVSTYCDKLRRLWRGLCLMQPAKTLSRPPGELFMHNACVALGKAVMRADACI